MASRNLWRCCLKTKVAFWLIPSEEDKAFFQEIIDTLAQEYAAPTFTPHVTIYVGEYAPDESLAEIIEKATDSVQSFSLKVDQLLYTEELTKTVFVQFHPNEIISNISNAIRSSSKKQSNFELNPHLSLIYQHLSEETKKNLVASISMSKSEVFFDEVQALSTGEKMQKPEDIESCEVIYTKKL